MSEYKPRLRTQLVVFATFFLVVLPAIWFSAMGYIWFIEHGLKLDTNSKPDGLMERLFILMLGLPIIPVMLAAILMAGIPWMFVMTRLLSLTDIEYFTKQNSKQKRPRLPFLSDWIDRLWLRMIESRRRARTTGRSSQ